ncbi:pikachurin-like [Bombus vosnesenskii]|uniref:Pikachurin-like n=3 Tax=Apinae TaxID=70987 RepID=A0A6J3KRC0_9HYME|nr:pikachurin-like [Bombus vancouverensis nearcticus]XP_033192694.1 pikachurin-like [Bombus vancouverensis nearcticus]XP_033192695.1 pikachurin-like [Bombus vancouverensis nearcticus]XP_033305779.1 pikachurin-like [Bombus bifarius]XP_033305781.1 pikachurin-like [Bombus bifarius]XP_033305782.1 pikachurin-like [Bombus bifarius]XP_033355630.1 pikachurin-like [Bombus vosnesenskii]XP_033355631.1 pikachurin-like [Bombus vosnesenskii]XP_033355632.1 pikachurin-like [Bombus vosnesenskii]XP_05048779
MAELCVCRFFVILAHLAVVLVLAQNPIEEKTTFEAAFQGRCGHGSPCEQLCYELHDGMYECDCKDGYILHKNGYSCAELNSTSPSTGELGELVEDVENDELTKDTDDDEDAVEDILYMRGASFTIHLDPPPENSTTNSTKISEETGAALDRVELRATSQGPNLEQKLPSTMESIVSTEPACSLDCGPAGNCYIEQNHGDDVDLIDDDDADDVDDDASMAMDLEGNDVAPRRKQGSFRQRCQCPLGRGGDRCQLEAEVRSPRFTGSGWLAFPALKAAYKHVQLELEFRPEAWDGILLLAGERDDLQGDFMALILHHGFIEFRFDCGSGVGTVRSTQTVRLNEWNTLTVYRHRWDAWIQLNQEKRVEGRSKGLFARITFREPLFVGGPGNTTGLERLPVRTGFKGCVRHLEANEHRYRFPLAPQGDAANGFDVEECTADRCSKVPCSHGGKCLTTGGDTAVCLCPLGYTGDLCETRVDLQVPSFNGSSYLRYPGLADTSLSWLELAVTLKPTAADGVILYNGHHSDATGDFIALYLSSGHVQFTFDLGTGPASLRSENPVRLGEWVEVRVSRTGRLASLEVEDDPPQEILAPGAFTQLSLPLNLYLGGAPSTDMYSPKMKTTASFVGCIQTVILNRREIGILAEALGGVNVGNCGHACEARPCGDAECRPLRDRFTCRCRPGMPHPCPAPDDNTILDSSLVKPNSGTRYERSVPSFSGSESYLHYNDADTMKRIISYRVDINMRFRASSSSGLLLWSGRQADPQEQRDENDDFLALGLDHGYLSLAYNLGSGEAVLRYNLTRLDDDLWHRVRAVRNEQWASLVVDSGTGVSASSPGQLRQLNTDTGLYVGGAPDIVRTTGGKYTKGIVGCISDLVLDSDFSVALSSPGQATNTHSCIP